MFKRVSAFCTIVFILLLLIPSNASASGSESLHANYTMGIFNDENGLPTGEANTIVQADDGYLWIGSYGGLIRYDGSTFVNFSNRLESSAIRSLFKASDGTIYIGTNDAGAYMFADDEFVHLESESAHQFLCVKSFAQAPNGVVYLASPSGVAKLSGENIIPYSFDKIENEQFLSVAVDSFENVWAISDSGNAYIFNEESFITKFSSSDFFSSGRIYSICADLNGNIYIGSSENQIVKISFDTSAAPDDIKKHPSTYYSTGDVSTLNNLKAARDGTVLVSALSGAGFIGDDGVFHRIDKNQDNVISANWAELDHEGNYWIASSNYGVIRFSLGCFDSCNYNSALGDHSVNAVAKQGDRFYVGTDNGLLIFDNDWNPIENDLTVLLQGIRVRNVALDTAGRVWMATYSEHGALCYDPATEETADFGMAQGLNSETVRVVYGLSDGRMLVGNQLGVNLIENGKITESYNQDDGMETTSVLCAMELNGHIYVGTDGSGIYEITDKGLVNFGFEQGLSQGVVLRMEPDADGNGNFYVCAGDKLFYYQNGYFKLLSGIEKGSGSIYSIYDVNGRIWLLQNGGVFSADKASVLAGEDSYTAQYGVKCGLTGTLSANTWNWIDNDNSIYMPTRNGISLFYFKGVNIIMPHAILNSVTIDDAYYEHPASIDIPSNAQRMTADISMLLFAETSEFILGYRLEGFDSEEYFTTDKHVSISYTNLKGGNYTLKLRIIDPLTGESTAERDIPITKRMQLTEHIWFWALLVLAGALLAFLISFIVIRRRTKKAEMRQKELQDIIDQALTTIAGTIDAKDEYTKGHSLHVAAYSREIAKRMGFSEDEQRRIYYIALLHDIGKIGVPDNILNKKGRLDTDELSVIKRHPVTGGNILKQFSALHGISDGARYHHERYDGKGYCKGISGQDIPIEARIIGIADSYDAMQSNRIYRPGLPAEVILEELQKGAGTQFDPEIVPIMCQMIKDGAAPIDYVNIISYDE